MTASLRQFVRAPGRSALVVCILAIGIGLNTALFSVVESIRTRPAPGIPASQSLVRVRGLVLNETDGSSWGRQLSHAEIQGLVAARDVFRSVAAWTSETALVEPGAADRAVTAMVSWVTPGYFDVLGLEPALGRLLPAEQGGEIEGVISHEFWTGEFGADTAVLGRVVRVRGTPVRIRGVAPRRFRGASESDSPRVVWLPLAALPLLGGSMDSASYAAAAALRDDVPLARASAAARIVTQRANPATGGERSRDQSAEVVPLLAYNDTPLAAGSDAALATIWGVALVVLLIAGTNVSVLLAGAGVRRRREIAVRLALGASRLRLLRQLLAESVVLAGAGALLGILALVAIGWISDARVVRYALVIEWKTVLASVAFALVTGVLSGLSPALHATRVSLSEALKGTGAAATSRLALQRRLVVLQIAATQPLLLGLAVMVFLIVVPGWGGRSHLGDNVVVVELNGIGSSASRASRAAQLADYTDRLAALPGVLGAAAMPGGFSGGSFTVRTDDRIPDRPAGFRGRVVSTAPGYFDMLEVPVERGRDFEPGETDALIIGTDLARRLFGAADPIGRRLQTGDRSVTIVGVVPAGRTGLETGGPGELVFEPATGGDAIGIWQRVLVRTAGPAEELIPEATRLSRQLVPGMALDGVRTLAAVERERIRQRFLYSGIASVGGLLALLLASVGLYASVALAVGQRTREIGIRVALGSRPVTVQYLFFREGLRLSLVGLALGLPLAVAVLKLLLTSIPVPGAALAAAVALGVVAITCLATWIPARGAARIDPMVALRAEG